MASKTLLTLVAATLAIAAFASNPRDAQASGAKICQNPAKGILQDWSGGTDTYLVNYFMNTVQIKNTSQTCAYKVGIASYTAVEDYRINVFSQRYFASKTHLLQPGEKWTYTIKIPECTYQVDVYWGDTIYKYLPPSTTYGGEGRFLDGWYFPGNNEQKGKLPVCTTPTPTPSPTPTPTPTHTPTPTPTPTPSTTPTPSATPTPTPTPTTTPTVLGSSTTPTPPAELPSTGPGAVVALAFGGPLGALLLKKYRSL